MATAAAPSKELLSALATLLEEGKYSDLTIKCGERKFAVHKALICSRSGFFDGACSNPFREFESGVIDLGEDDEEAVEHMVNYLYHLDYLASPRSGKLRGSTRSSRSYSFKSPPMSPIALRPLSPERGRKKLNLALVEDPLLATAAAHVLTPPQISTSEVPADAQSQSQQGPTSYPSAVTGSRILSSASNPQTPPAEDNFRPSLSLKTPPPADSGVEDLDNDWSDGLQVDEQEPDMSVAHLVTHCKVYAIAEKYGIAGLKSLARAKFGAQMTHHYHSPEFAEALFEVYDTTVESDRGLRDIVIQTFREHPELAQSEKVEPVVKELPALAFELFKVGWGLPVY